MDGYIDKILTSFVETVMNFDVFQESFIFLFFIFILTIYYKK